MDSGFPWAGFWLFVIVVLAFMVCREIVCWYFKLSAIHHELARIEKHLQRIADVTPTPMPPAAELPRLEEAAHDWMQRLKDATLHWTRPS